MMNEIAKKRLEKAGTKICLDIVIHPDVDWFSWTNAWVREQLKHADISDEVFAQTLETIARDIRESRRT